MEVIGAKCALCNQFDSRSFVTFIYLQYVCLCVCLVYIFSRNSSFLFSSLQIVVFKKKMQLEKLLIKTSNVPQRLQMVVAGDQFIARYTCALRLPYSTN